MYIGKEWLNQIWHTHTLTNITKVSRCAKHCRKPGSLQHDETKLWGGMTMSSAEPLLILDLLRCQTGFLLFNP